MIDFHSHILPCLDHGSDSLETSLRQINIAKKYNISTIVATSHFYPTELSVQEFIDLRQQAYNQLMVALPDNSPQILLGAEVTICTDFNKIPDIHKLCIQGTNTMLVELPHDVITSDILYTLDLLSFKYNVIIAHIDRYSEYIVNELVKSKYRLQLNASTFDKRKYRKKALNIIDTDLVYAIGTDIHGDCEEYYKSYINALKYLDDYKFVIQDRMSELIK